jgi:anti-sigma factor RsiW
MTQEERHIQQIEDFLLGRLSREERSVFERRLEQDAGLRSDVATYQQLFQGLRALSTEQLSRDMRSWHFSEGVDQEEQMIAYLQGELGEEESRQFEEKIKADKKLALEVERQRALEKGFQSIKVDALANEMRSWREDAKVRPLNRQRGGRLLVLRRIAAAAAVALILLFVGGKWYANSQFGRSALTEVHFKEVFLDESTLSSTGQAKELPEDLLKLQEAAEAFEAENYKEAERLYSLLADRFREGVEGVDPSMARDYADLSEWNAVLALLFSGGSREEVKVAALRITQDTEHIYRIDAYQLLEKMDHPLWWLR